MHPAPAQAAPSSFASSSSSFALPNVGASGGNRPFPVTADVNAQVTASTNHNYVTMDIDGDHQLDLVVTSRTDDASLGVRVWKIYRGTCSSP